MQINPVVYLHGGLGNQLFQYHFALALKSQYNVEVSLDTSIYKTLLETRNPSLFKLISPELCVKDSNVIRFLGNKIQNKIGYHRFLETDLTYTSESKLKYFYYGYWQSQYIQNDILKKIKANILEIHLDKLSQKKISSISVEDVAIHVRRGDYLNEKNRNIYQSLSANYYKNSLQLLHNIAKINRVFVFSDDVNWCRENLDLKYETVFVDWNANEIDDFVDLLSFRRKILSNSTFSFWSALLTNCTERIVVPHSWKKNDDWRPKYLQNWIVSKDLSQNAHHYL
jgi:hypothetical protein